MSSPFPIGAVQPDDSPFDLDFDLDSARSARTEVGPAPAVRLGGVRHELPRELPIDVLEPLTTINVDVSVLVRQVLDARNAAKDSGEAVGEEILGAVIDMLVLNPSLPTEIVEAAKEMARRLMGPDAYAALVAFRPTVADLGALAKHIGRLYGVRLGEASRSSDSSADSGTTSKPTSAGEAETSATSGVVPTTPAS